MTKHKLRIGLLLESNNLSSWSFSCIESLIHSEYAEIVLVIKNEILSEQNTAFSSKINQISYSVFRAIENKIHKPNPDALIKKNLNSILDNCKERSSLTIETEDLKQLDLIVQLDQNPIPKQLLQHVKYGIWSYYFGDYTKERKGPVGVYELFENQIDTKVSLHINGTIVNEDSVIYETSFSNDKLYCNRHANTIYWEAAHMLPRMIKELYESEPDEFFKKWLDKYSNSKIQKHQDYKFPSNFQTIKAVSKLYWKAFKGIIERRSYFEQWILLFQINSDKKRPKSFHNFKRILPPKDRIWADPFVIERKDTYYIFIEELLFSEPYGKIAVIEMDKDGNYKSPETVIERPYHLSYPFLAEDNGELYMLPETMGNNTIELYKCIAFPYKWELEKVIMNNIKAVDSTLFKHDDTYWLFTNIEEFNGIKTSGELHLFYSDSLLSDHWIAHKQNPIVTDKSCARPAGHIYESENCMFRPAQDCTKHYGYGIKINEITSLNTATYKERLKQTIYPDWSKDMFSTHTINASGDLTVMDAKIKRKR
ncbi:glucosamine inositolphosphorylceramide transferase family protein [Psychroserpens mesophilus]|uniref:glucosamine inositolphosphorylceramide transferase family protein n=1 Tax=Psychroserpens mesophilus TaxID=325473 RepID=UPI003D64CB53